MTANTVEPRFSVSLYSVNTRFSVTKSGFSPYPDFQIQNRIRNFKSETEFEIGLDQRAIEFCVEKW